MLVHALDYARRGWRVFPAYPIIPNRHCTCPKQYCSNPGEHPRIRDWLNRATTDEEQIREWCKRWPRSNVAIATGQASGIVVLEVDSDIWEQECALELNDLFNMVFKILEKTLWAFSGDGREHFYFAIEGEIRCRNNFLPGIGLHII